MTHSRGERITIETKKLGTAVVYGVLSIFIFGAATSLIFSLFLRFSSMDESSLTYVIMAASFISLFIGGFISGGKGKRQGWVLGGGTGLLYTLIILLFHYLGHDALFTMKQWISSICLILTSMMGGILGVNLKSGSRTN
ncbi:TIGR04086 family membrane protein [Peribacillus saganii]|uniref:TIGR04086 family membrane protein n=2 Tax=Peribacillus saganii TaxID=2303992 RepID=A0A372LUG5_9BACI|nr:TIGR04086 family membrane protein [Peribacillus saganii]